MTKSYAQSEKRKEFDKKLLISFFSVLIQNSNPISQSSLMYAFNLLDFGEPMQKNIYLLV